MLVERIIQIISDRNRRVDIDRLLVVTFTKAAASEMRSRVGDAIERMLMPYALLYHFSCMDVLLSFHP